MDPLRSVRQRQLVILDRNCAVDTLPELVVRRRQVRTYFLGCSRILRDLEQVGMAAAVVVAQADTGHSRILAVDVVDSRLAHHRLEVVEAVGMVIAKSMPVAHSLGEVESSRDQEYQAGR